MSAATVTASASNKKHGSLKEWQWWAENNIEAHWQGLMPIATASRWVFPKCFRLTTTIFLLKIAIRWADIKICSLETVTVAAPWLKIQLRRISLQRNYWELLKDYESERYLKLTVFLFMFLIEYLRILTLFVLTKC